MADYENAIRTEHARLRALHAAAERDLGGRSTITRYAADKARSKAYASIKAAVGQEARGPIWLNGERIQLRCYPDRKKALRLSFYRHRSGRTLEVSCLPYQIEQIALWGYHRLLAAAGTVEPLPAPYPMSKELEQFGLKCRYVWTLAALEACGLNNSGGYAGAACYDEGKP